MKCFIYLLILELTQLQCIFSIYMNKTQNYEFYSLCPISNLRRKRAQTDYKRWRADLESSPEEFIIRVLDEDRIISKTTPIAAVNIVRGTKRQEKIVINGAIVPSMALKNQDKDIVKDYTRFVPPRTNTVQIREVVSTPIPRIKIDNHILHPEAGASYGIKPHTLRSYSPPTSPQFLPRTPMLLARQFPPIVITKSLESSTHSVHEHSVSQTSLKELMLLSTRTKSENNMTEIDSIIDEEHPYSSQHDLLTQSIFVAQQVSLPSTAAMESDEFYGLTELDSKINDTGDINKINEKKDFDTLYKSIFYNDEDNGSKGENLEQSSSDYYENDDELLTNTESRQSKSQRPSSIDFRDVLKNLTSVIDHSYVDDDDLHSETDIFSSKEGVIKTEQNVLKLTDKIKHINRRQPICNLLSLRQLTFNSPRTLPEIMAQLKQWAEGSPVAKWIDITNGNYTTMENPIYLIIVDDPSSGQIISAKQTVMILAGIQGRDHHAVAAAMYILYELIERSEAHVDLLTQYRFWIIPVFNPDGYDYSMTFPSRRNWIKNLKQSWDICKDRESCYACENYGLRCTIQSCYGVNLDRNFEYQWLPAEEVGSEHPCGDLYAGPRQLSETETRALSHFLFEQKSSLYTFIAFKEGDILGVMYPYSHTKKKRAFDHVYRQRATRAAAAAYSISGRPYVAGQSSEFLPLYAGGIEDWVEGHLGIDNTYTIMMFRHTDAYNAKLLTECVLHEAYAAVDTLLLQSEGPLHPGAVKLVRANIAANLHYLNSIMLNVIALLLFNN